MAVVGLSLLLLSLPVFSISAVLRLLRLFGHNLADVGGNRKDKDFDPTDPPIVLFLRNA